MGNNYVTTWSRIYHSGVAVALIYVVAAFLLRFPFFFRDYIDRDESTFILMAQSWLDGYLPYTQLWDLKPPMVFAFFAGVIGLFGKTFIAIRMAGVFLVAGTAISTYFIGKKIGSARVGFWAGMATIYFLSLFGSLQGVMSEHLSMFFFMPGLYLLFRFQSPERIFLSGILFGLALMTKLNLAYPVLFVGILLVLSSFRNRQWLQGIGRGILFAIALVMVFAAFSLPYALSGKVELWWDSVILAPLAYASGDASSLLNVAPLLLIVAFFFLLVFKRGWLKLQEIHIQFLVVAICGVLVSFLKVGRVNGHYLIQLYPLILLLVALVLSRSLPTWWRKALPVLVFLLPMESYKEYYEVYAYEKAHDTYFNGEGISVPNWVQMNDLGDQNIFFLEYHIGYWLLDAHPPVPSATHPSNICRDELFPYFDNPRENGLEEIRYIMEEEQPELVVVREGKPVFDREQIQENNYINAYLALNYTPLKSIGDALVLQRN